MKLFTQTSCPQCLIAKRVIEQRRLTGIDEVNLTEEPEWIGTYNLTSVPSLLIDDMVVHGGNDVIKFLRIMETC